MAANDAATAAEAGRQLALGRMVQAALLAGVPFGAAAIAMVVRRWWLRYKDQGLVGRMVLEALLASVALGLRPLQNVVCSTAALCPHAGGKAVSHYRFYAPCSGCWPGQVPEFCVACFPLSQGLCDR